jgi:hypothetical protein
MNRHRTYVSGVLRKMIFIEMLTEMLRKNIACSMAFLEDSVHNLFPRFSGEKPRYCSCRFRFTGDSLFENPWFANGFWPTEYMIMFCDINKIYWGIGREIDPRYFSIRRCFRMS